MDNVKETLPKQGLFFWPSGLGLDARKTVIDGAKDVTDDRAKQHQDCNNYDSDKDEDQCILYQALAFFLGCEQHNISTPFMKNG
jgi:hypothetical protein